MATSEEIQDQNDLLDTHRRTLHVYLRQQARLGEAYLPPASVHGIEEARKLIQQIKSILREWGEYVEDQPDDEAQTSEVLVRSSRITVYADVATYVFTNKTNIIMDRDASLFCISITNMDNRSVYVSGLGFTANISGNVQDFTLLNIVPDPIFGMVNPTLPITIEPQRKRVCYYRLGLLIQFLKQKEDMNIMKVFVYDETNNKYTGNLTQSLQEELLRLKTIYN